MTPGVRPLVAGNWKMNGLTASLGEIVTMRKAADAGRRDRRNFWSARPQRSCPTPSR